jgi:hypothetical protein
MTTNLKLSVCATLLVSAAIALPTVADAQDKKKAGASSNQAVIAKCRQKYPEPQNFADRRVRGRDMAMMRQKCIASGGKS